MIFGHTIVSISYIQLSYYLIVKVTQWCVNVLYCKFKSCLIKPFCFYDFKAYLVRAKIMAVNGAPKIILYAVIHQN